jgi:hypothetical protein
VTGETVDAKARRLIADGRVTVVEVKPRRRLVTVQGDTGTHRVLWLHTQNGWRCSCPSRAEECSHTRAAHLAVLDRLPESAVWYSRRDGWQQRMAP